MSESEMALLTVDSCLDLIACVEDINTIAELGIPPMRTYHLIGTCRWGHGVQMVELTRWPNETTYPSLIRCPVVSKAGGSCSDISVEAIVETTAL